MELRCKKNRMVPISFSTWTYRRPNQALLKLIKKLIDTKWYLVHANLSISCLLNLHAQENTQLYNSNIQNRVLRNIVGCPAGARATHFSQNVSFANLLRRNVSLHMGQWMLRKQSFPKTLPGENARNGHEKHMFFLMHKDGLSHVLIFAPSHAHMRDFQTTEILPESKTL